MENNHDNSIYNAQFTALMHAFGARLGAEALEENAALQKDLSAAVPESVCRRCMETIAHYGTTISRTVRRVFLRIAVAALVALMLFATAFAVSPTLREKTITFFKEIFDTHTEFRISEGTGTDLSNYEIEVGWLPDGMELVEDIQGRTSRILGYESANKMWIRISMYSIDIGTASADSENADSESIILHNQTASLITNENSLQLIVEIRKERVLIKLSGESISRSDFLLIAENLRISQK